MSYHPRGIPNRLSAPLSFENAPALGALRVAAVLLILSVSSHAAVHIAGGLPAAIPAFGEPALDLALEISGEPTSILELQIAIEAKNTRVGDLAITLVAPDTRQFPVTPPPSQIRGEHLKKLLSAAFPGGVDPNGTWHLLVNETRAKSHGEVRGWTLEINDASTNRKSLIQVAVDPLHLRSLVFGDEAGRVTGRVGLGATSLTSAVIYNPNMGDIVTYLFRGDGSIAKIKTSQGYIALSPPKKGVITVHGKFNDGTVIKPVKVDVPATYEAEMAALKASLKAFLKAAHHPSPGDTGARTAESFLTLEPAAGDGSLLGDLGDFLSHFGTALAIGTGVVAVVVAEAPAELAIATGGLLLTALDIAFEGSDNQVIKGALTLGSDEFLVYDCTQALAKKGLNPLDDLSCLGDVASFLGDQFKEFADGDKDKPEQIFSLGQTVTYSGGPEEDVEVWFNPLAALGLTNETEIDWDFYSIPDEMQVFQQGDLVFDTGYISDTGSQTFNLGPGDEMVTIIMNPGGNPDPGTEWTYTFGPVTPEPMAKRQRLLQSVPNREHGRR